VAGSSWFAGPVLDRPRNSVPIGAEKSKAAVTGALPRSLMQRIGTALFCRRERLQKDGFEIFS
jgi:hypothetical protein